MKRSFWEWPPLWVWVLFVFSLSLLGTAYVTTREGLRYVSRSLRGDEEKVVLAALDAWDELTDDRSADTTGRLRVMVHTRRLRGIDGVAFVSSRERSTFGYTDERGRILLNPCLCFGSLTIRGRGEVYAHDLVVTLSTMVHEDEHFTHQAGEREAYLAEWQFLRRAVGVARSRELPYAEELAQWESHTAQRVAENLGPTLASQLEEQLDATVSYRRLSAGSR